MSGHLFSKQVRLMRCLLGFLLFWFAAVPQAHTDRLTGVASVIDGDTLVGIALSVQVDYKRFSNPHTYEDIVGANDVIRSNPDGDALYGLDVVIKKSHRGMRIGRRLYDARKELCRQSSATQSWAGLAIL